MSVRLCDGESYHYHHVLDRTVNKTPKQDIKPSFKAGMGGAQNAHPNSLRRVSYKFRSHSIIFLLLPSLALAYANKISTLR